MTSLDSNSHSYFGNSDEEIKEMMDALNITSIDELFSNIPSELWVKSRLGIQGPYREADLYKFFLQLSLKNVSTRDAVCFIGGGSYEHYIPSIVDMALARNELYSSYTPYQAETSQGMLQLLFEYQSQIAELIGFDTVNASLYDWSTAIGEAILMSSRLTKRYKALYCSSISNSRLEVMKTYCNGPNITLDAIPYDTTSGRVDLSNLKKLDLEEYACIYIETPNYFGIIEDDLPEIAALAKRSNTLLIVGVTPLSLALFESPGNYGADIVVGDGQSIGNYLSFGGPHLGILGMNFDKKNIRQFPGRLVGVTPEKSTGRIGFSIVLSTREQHIRRERATSNICSNQSLNAVATSIYLSAVGTKGFEQRAESATSYAHYLAEQIEQIPGITLPFSGDFFQEFVISLPGSSKEFVQDALKANFLLNNKVLEVTKNAKHISLAVDHWITKKEIDQFVEFVKKWVHNYV